MRHRSIALSLALVLAASGAACDRSRPSGAGEAAGSMATAAVGSGGATVGSGAAAANAPEPWSLGAGEAAFASAVMTEAGRAPGNLCFSPASLRMTGALLALLSRGDTEAELRRAFDLASDPGTVASPYAVVQASLADRDAATVRLAAGLWTQSGTALEPDRARLSGTFGAQVGTLDFAARPDAARDAINAWAAEQTAGKLTALVPPRGLARDTSMAVASVLLFRAEWSAPWSSGSAEPAPFTTADGRRVEVPMLRGYGREIYFENRGYQAVWLDYAGAGLGMILVLPRRGLTVADVQASALRLARGHFASTEVQLAFPMFRLESRADVVPLLQRLGVQTLFDPARAQLRTVDARGPVYLRTFVHEASIAIDERGTEVVAGTLSYAPPAAATVHPEPMIVDRPFLFFIRDENTRSLLAVGRVDDPSAN